MYNENKRKPHVVLCSLFLIDLKNIQKDFLGYLLKIIHNQSRNIKFRKILELVTSYICFFVQTGNFGKWALFNLYSSL